MNEEDKYTYIPNYFFDDYLHKLSDQEIKVYVAYQRFDSAILQASIVSDITGYDVGEVGKAFMSLKEHGLIAEGCILLLGV